MFQVSAIPKWEKRIGRELEFCIEHRATLLQSAKDLGRLARSSRHLAFERRLLMFSRSILLKTILFASVLITFAAAASATTPSDPSTQVSAGTVRTYLTPDLTLKSYFPELAQASAAGFRKTCRCSCGTAFCATDADCGGGVGSCSAFISCCAKQPAAQSFQSSDQVSRQTAAPSIDNCK